MGVQPHNHVAARLGDDLVHRRGLNAARVVDPTQGWVALGEFVQQFTGAVVAAAVRHDHLEAVVWVVLLVDAANALLNVGLFVEAGDAYGDESFFVGSH